MKKVLSCILSVVMLVSVLGLNAFAVVPDAYLGVIPGTPQKTWAQQSYSGEASTAFIAPMSSGYGAGGQVVDPVDETNNVFSLKHDVTSSAVASFIHSGTTYRGSALGEDCKTLTVEFKVYPKDIAETLHVSLRMPYFVKLMGEKFPANKYTVDGSPVYKGLDWVIYHQNFIPNQWNTVKVEVDVPDDYAFGTNSSYPESYGGKSATITVNDTVLKPKDSGVATPEAGKYFVRPEAFGTSAVGQVDLMAMIGFFKAGSNNFLNPAEGEREILFDDLMVYEPGIPDVEGMIDYPLERGKIVHTIEEEFTVSAAMDGFDNTSTKQGSQIALHNPVDKTNTKFYISFDARANEIGSYPMTMQLASGKSGAINFAANKEGWYTYKIYLHGGGSASLMEFVDYIACKPAGSNEPFTPMVYATDYTKGRDGTGANNYCVRFSWVANLSTKLGWEADKIATTEWDIRNFQVVEAATDGAYRALATAKEDGTADVEVYFSTIKESVMPFVAVYDTEGRLVDAKCAEAVYQFDGTFETNVKYEAGNNVMLFFWENANGTPYLNSALALPVL